MIEIYYAKSSEWEKQATLSSLLRHLPEKISERALRYRFSIDAYNFVLGRLMLKKALKESGLSEELLKEIYYNEAEKPLIQGLSFSISHSQDLVACAFSKEGNIGLDVEFPRSIQREHFRHCFNEKEWSLIQIDKSMHTFYRFWTQKEAILKANGVGLGHLLNITIKDETTADFYNEETNKSSTWNLKNLKFDNSEAYACLCTNLDSEILLEKFHFIGD